MSSSLYQYDEFSDSDDQSSESDGMCNPMQLSRLIRMQYVINTCRGSQWTSSPLISKQLTSPSLNRRCQPSSLFSNFLVPFSAAEVEQNSKKKRQKGSSPNFEDFLPSEKRTKYNKKLGNLLSGVRSLEFGKVGNDLGGGAGAAANEDSDSDLEILREQAAEEATKAEKEQQQKDLLQAKRRGKGGSGAAMGQPEDAWKDRQLVARSRAWLNKSTDKDQGEEEEEDDLDVVLGDTSDEESPLAKKKVNQRHQQQQAPDSNPAASVEEFDAKSPDFTTAVPSGPSKGLVIINAADKYGHRLQIRVKTKHTLGKLFQAFRTQAEVNVC
jgi:hypothetical protein